MLVQRDCIRRLGEPVSLKFLNERSVEIVVAVIVSDQWRDFCGRDCLLQSVQNISFGGSCIC